MINKITTAEMSTCITNESSPVCSYEDLPIESIASERPFITPFKNASVSMKIYRSKLINEILNAHSIDEVRSNINENLLQIKNQAARTSELTRYISYIIEELNDLNGSAIANEYYMNLSAAGTYLRQLSVPVK